MFSITLKILLFQSSLYPLCKFLEVSRVLLELFPLVI